MKPKEWLLKNGHISTIGRGRLSIDNINLIKKAVGEGVYIEGYSDTGAVRTKRGIPVKSKPIKEMFMYPEIVDLTPYVYPEDEFVAVERDNGKRVIRSLREICRHTGYSLVVCPFEGQHTITARNGDTNGAIVTIERKS